MAPPRNRRPGFSRRAQYGLFLGYVLAVGGMLIGGVLLLISRFNPPAFAAMSRAVAEVTTPVSSGMAWVGDGISGIPAGIGSYLNVRTENARLKKQIADERRAVEKAVLGA